MSSSDQSIMPQEVCDLAQSDLDFVFQLRRLGEVSNLDIRVWGALIQEHYNLQTVRRLYVRMFGSLVESILATLKRETLTTSGQLSLAERALLADTAHEISDQGKAVDRPFFAPIQKTLRFAFRSFAKANRLDFAPDYGGEGWSAFLETIKIRNRLTHPKRIEAMVVSDSEMALVDKAHDWFIETYRALLDSHIAKLKAMLSEQGTGGL